MALPSFFIDVQTQQRAQLERDLGNGGLYVAGAAQPLNQHCEITFRFPDVEHVVDARVVFADPRGIGLELFVDAEQRAALLAKIRATETASADAAGAELGRDRAAAAPWAGADDLDASADRDGEQDDDDGDGGWADWHTPGEDDASADADTVGRATFAPTHGGDGAPARGAHARRGDARHAPVHERVRNLSVGEQVKLAHHGEQQERILLERIYGKTVWEALLRNPRITAPEVARIARMGALPRPLLEIIVGNAVWLQVPEVRRALLGNPRLAAEMIPRVLRLLPRHELKLVPAQLAYPAAVRDVARRMLRE